MQSLLDLLPKGGASIVDSLPNEMKFFRRLLFLIQEAEEALRYFLKGELSHFDPHVGDTACQIRAYYFALLWTQRKEIFPSLEHDLVQLKTYAEKIMVLIDQGKQNLHQSFRPCTLLEFLERLDLNLTTSAIGILLTMAHLLSKYRYVDKECISQSIDYAKLQYAILGEKRFSLELSRHWQKKLSAISIKFIKDLVKKLENQKAKMQSSLALTKDLLRKDSYGREQLPCLMSFEVITQALELNKGIPIAWILDWPEALIPRTHLIFQVNTQGHWCLEKINELSPDIPLFILRGLTQVTALKEFLSTIENLGITNLICYMASDHAQYSGLTDNPEFPTEYQSFYKDYLHKARHHKVGLGNEGRLLLAFKHVCVCRAGEFLAYVANLPSLNVRMECSDFVEV